MNPLLVGAPCSGGSNWDNVESAPRTGEQAPTARRLKQVKRCSGYGTMGATIYRLFVVASLTHYRKITAVAPVFAGSHFVADS